MTRTLVTGGSGFIGKHLVSALVKRGREVTILDVRAPHRAESCVRSVTGSVLDPVRLQEALEGVDEVYHLAGLPGMWMPRKQDFHTVNTLGTEAVISAARRQGVARFLHCSTESILFAQPGSAGEGALLPADDMPGPYTRSKLLADQHAMQAAASGFPLIVACPTMPIGPDDHNLTPPTAMLRHFLGKRIQLYLDFVVNLVDVRDAAEGLVLAMERGAIGHRYVIGGESITLKRVLRLMAEISNRRGMPIPVPARLAEAAAAMMELIAAHVTGRPPSGTREGVRIALRARALSIEKAQRELGYAPKPVEPALREAIAGILGTAGDGARYDLSRSADIRPEHPDRRYGV